MPVKWPVIAFVGLFVAGLVFVAFLGRSIISDFHALSTANDDDLSWRMSQLEVELLRAESAVVHAEAGLESDLSNVRKRFDIFYSRIDTLKESAVFDAIRSDPESARTIAAASEFLERTVPLIDGPDDALRAALPEIEAQFDGLQPEIRRFALSGVQRFAQKSVAHRESISQTLLKLAITLCALILLLVTALVFLFKLFRQGRRYLNETLSARSRFEAAIGSSLDAVLVMDTEGRVIEFNGAATQVFGYERQEAIGADMAELIMPAEQRSMHRRSLQQFIATGAQSIIRRGRIRVEAVRKSGENFPVEMSVSLTETGGERVFISFLRDITPEIEAEQELRNARDRAEESERAKSNLLTVMSHEMRTPLNGILGSLALIERDNLSERQKRHLNSIELSGELLLSHVNDVLNLSSLDADSPPQKKVAFNLPELVRNAASSLAANAEARGNQLRVTFLSDDLGFVLGLKTALQRCLVNLLGNAIKFTTGGTVSVEVERLAKDDLIEIRVADTGVGIAPENLDRIFEEFVTIDTTFARENVGTGLGLAITRRLIAQMGAEIEVDSILDEGSIFTMRIPLPAIELPTFPAAPDPDVSVMPVPAGLSALIVDDNAINRMILTDMVSDLGFEVAQASDGPTAIAAVQDRQFDLVLMDISMPGMDGIEALRRIRALPVDWQDLPVIAVTAHASQKDRDVILNANFATLLVKPVNPSELRDIVRAILGLEVLTPSTNEAKAPVAEFEMRFGAEKYQAALCELAGDLARLLGSLTPISELSGEDRQLAHKLSGSAAVLGKQRMWDYLCELQETDRPLSRERKRLLLTGLRRELAALPGAAAEHAKST